MQYYTIFLKFIRFKFLFKKFLKIKFKLLKKRKFKRKYWKRKKWKIMFYKNRFSKNLKKSRCYKTERLKITNFFLKLKTLFPRKIRKWRRKKIVVKKDIFSKIKLNLNTFATFSKKNSIKDILYFLKYFLIFRKKDYRILRLMRVKTKLSKLKKKTKAKKKLIFNKYIKDSISIKNTSKRLNLIKLKLYFGEDPRYEKLYRIYDLKKKATHYFNVNRKVYKNFNIKLKQNYRFLKTHITNISNLSIKSRTHLFEFSLSKLLIRLKYAYTIKSATHLIKSGLFFLNGKQEFNPNKCMYVGDYLEILLSKFLFLIKKKIKKRLKISMRKYKRYNWKWNKNKIKFDTKYIRLLRFSKQIMFYKDRLPSNLQYDLRTLTFLMVKGVNVRRDLTYFNKRTLPIYLLKLLNWKLIS